MPTGGSRSPRRGARVACVAASASADAEHHRGPATVFADFSRAQNETLAAFGSRQVSEHHKFRTDFKADLAAFVGPLDKGYRKRFDRLELEQSDVRKKVTHLRSQMGQVSVRVGALGDTLQAASQATPPSVAIDNGDFNRDPIDTIVRVWTQTDVTAVALLDPVKEPLTEMRPDPSAYEWGAQPLGRAGTLRFNGSLDLRVRKFFSLS